MTSETRPLHCPICEEEVRPRAMNKSFPFCSARCKMEDLGKWLGGQYAVAGPAADPLEVAAEMLKKNSQS